MPTINNNRRKLGATFCKYHGWVCKMEKSKSPNHSEKETHAAPSVAIKAKHVNNQNP